MEPVSAAEQRELKAVVPMISAHFKRARSDMPASLREAFAAHGLSPRHGAALAAVLSAESISVSELAKQLGIGLTNASQITGDLTRAGWLQRDPDPADHRRVLLSLPPDRRDEVSGFIDRRSDSLLRAMSRLTAGERAGFLAGLRAWQRELEQS
ncbi:MarR family winged helix-turn-helix transcriptional regulator [Nocardia sp. NPDC088792]|uniref:MarR family winged helix-turn-helix transcriptional regulator n=1 Tax=Nocardia sp. NPDC088792 TaxID=3364332 RepID=UPI00382E097F